MPTSPIKVSMPVYDAAYYATYADQPYERSGQWMALAHHFADRIVSVLQPQTVLDVGCAIGMVVEALRDRGVEASGIDVSEYAISQVPAALAEWCAVGSLVDPIEGRFDLVTCIEVIEHLPASDADTAVANLCGASDRILLSSTPYEHEEPTHLNVQPPEYWSALFARQGFFRNLDIDVSFISPWAVLYEKGRADLPERIRAYDRAFWRQRDEILRVRSALLAATSATSAPSIVETDAVDAELSEQRRALEEQQVHIERLQADLIAERHDKLRMTDEVEAVTRRLGTALGRVTELEGEIGRLASAGDRYNEVVQSTTWRLMWIALTPYRAVRARLGRS